jgi:hypothetical protein
MKQNILSVLVYYVAVPDEPTTMPPDIKGEMCDQVCAFGIHKVDGQSICCMETSPDDSNPGYYTTTCVWRSIQFTALTNECSCMLL